LSYIIVAEDIGLTLTTVCDATKSPDFGEITQNHGHVIHVTNFNIELN